MEIFEERIVVQKILPQDKSEAEHEDDLKQFLSHLDLILQHQERIIHTPEYFYVLLQRVHVGDSITGIGYIPLGALLLLWKEGHLLCRCPKCFGPAYIFQAGGSLLSGSHSCSAFCHSCSQRFCYRAGSFSQIWSPVFEKRKAFPNSRTVRIRKTQGFRWSKGLVGEPTPDEILKDGIHPVDIKELIALLKNP